MNRISDSANAAPSRRTLILGGAGFLGSNLARAMVAAGRAVRVFTRRPPEGAEPRSYRTESDLLDYYFGDFTSERDLSEALEGCDTCVHLVTTTLPGSSNDDIIYDVETNLVSTLRLLELLVQKKSRQLIYVSSGGTVYGNPLTVPINEDHPTNPSSSYGITKLAVEKYIALYGALKNLNGTVLRVSNPYGPGQRVRSGQGAIGVFLSRALRGEAIEVWGDGSIVRDYLYVADVVTAITAAIDTPTARGIYNIGSGTGLSLNQIIEAIGEVLGHPLNVSYQPGRSFDVSKSILDISRARHSLNWKPSIALNEGLLRTVDWLRSQPTGRLGN